jgi:hypothetical protein
LETKKNTVFTFLVLVPHQETRLILRKYCENLYNNIPAGAYDFPLAAPIAVLERPLAAEELKQRAKEIRKAMGNNKFAAAGINSVFFSGGEKPLFIFGPKIDAVPGAKLLPVIGCCLLPSKTDIALPEPPKITFRAAAVANMFWKPANGGFKWKIGKLYWLPKEDKASERRQGCQNRQTLLK